MKAQSPGRRKGGTDWLRVGWPPSDPARSGGDAEDHRITLPFIRFLFMNAIRSRASLACERFGIVSHTISATGYHSQTSEASSHGNFLRRASPKTKSGAAFPLKATPNCQGTSAIHDRRSPHSRFAAVRSRWKVSRYAGLAFHPKLRKGYTLDPFPLRRGAVALPGLSFASYQMVCFRRSCSSERFALLNRSSVPTR